MDKHSIHKIYQNQKYKEVIDKTLNGPHVLEKASMIYSCILNRTNDKLFMINKVKGQTPNFPLDWNMYLILKAFSRVLITSGNIVKDEGDYNFFQNFNVYEDQTLIQYHKQRNPQKQKVFLLSNAITNGQVQRFINNQFYDPILIEQSHPDTIFKTIPTQSSLNGYFQKLMLSYGQPLLFQCGVTSLNEYLSQTLKNKNLINLVVIGEYKGELPQICKGKQVDINFNKYFSCIYISQQFKCNDGILVYYVYGSKQNDTT